MPNKGEQMKKKALSLIVFSLILQGCFDVYEMNKPIEERIMETNQNVSIKVKQQNKNSPPILIGISENKMIYLPQGRDPFIPAGIMGVLIPQIPIGIPVQQYTRLTSDPSRPNGYQTGPFEKYELEQITMIGVMSQPNGAQAALINVGNDKIIMLHKGDYIGKDHGLVTEITERKVSIEEKFGAATRKTPDAWVVQPNEIPLQIK